MAHSLPDVEKEALRLSPEDRARLAVRLLSSLEGAAESPEEIEKLWIAEAGDALKNYATASCRGYLLGRSSLSCGPRNREGDDLPPGSPGGDARISRVL